MRLQILPGSYGIAYLPPDRAVPSRLLDVDGSSMVSVTRTAEELSIVGPVDRLPAGERASLGWTCLMVEGPLELLTVGILAELSGLLRGAEVSLFAVSTYRTDYVLVATSDLDRAADALTGGGHEVVTERR